MSNNTPDVTMKLKDGKILYNDLRIRQEAIVKSYEQLTFPVNSGTLCIYSGKTYIAKQDIASSESWTAAHWDETNIGDELNTVKNAITTINVKTDWVTPQQYGAKGDGVTDDTLAFQQLNGKRAFIPTGTYRISSVVYGSNTVINGAGMDNAIIKQTANCNDDMISFVDADGSSLTNITLLGCGGETGEQEHTYLFQALLKIYNLQTNNANRCLYEHINIRNAPVNGMVMQGYQSVMAGDFDDRLYDERHLTTKYNWVHHFNDIRIEHCYRWCLIDNGGTDNRWDNLYLSDGDVGCFMMHNASSNMYCNIKIDQPYILGTSGSASGFVDGAGLLMNNCYSDVLTNLDVQSAVYVGIKMHSCHGDKLSGILNNCGRDDVFQGIGLIIDDSQNCELNFEFHRVNHDPEYNTIINANCRNVMVYALERNTSPSVNNRQEDCSIVNIAQKMSKVYNKTFNLNMQFTNLLQNPLCESTTGWTGQTTTDTTGKVAGQNSFIINESTDTYAACNQEVNTLESGKLYLAAFAYAVETANPSGALPSMILVDSNGNAINTPAEDGGFRAFSYESDPVYSPVQTVHVRMNVFKAPQDGYVKYRVTNSAKAMKIYIGNFMLTKVTGNILESQLTDDFWIDMYENLTTHFNTAFSSMSVDYSVGCSDIMEMLKLLMNGN